MVVWRGDETVEMLVVSLVLKVADCLACSTADSMVVLRAF